MADAAYEVRTVDRLIAIINRGDDCAEATKDYHELLADAAAIIEEVRKHFALEEIGCSDLPPELAVVVLPDGKKLHDLRPYIDALRNAPKRIETNAAMTSVASFVDYLDRFKTADSAIFVCGDVKTPQLVAVIDYHGQGDEAEPRFGRHRVGYSFPISEQMKAWAAVSGQAMDHAAFATFLQDRQYDISNPPLDWMQVQPETLQIMFALLNLADDADDAGDVDDAATSEFDVAPEENGEDRYVPRSALYKLRRIRFGSAARLIQMARTIEVSVNAKSVEGYSPKTGERTVTFSEEHETRDDKGRRIVVPEMFLLRVPVWEGETPQLILVRLQYRRVNGALRWAMTLVEWKRVLLMAIKAEAERAGQATMLPVFFGTP